MPLGPDKIYTARFSGVIDILALIRGLQDAGFDIRMKDIKYEPNKGDEVQIRFQTGHLGKAAVHALQGLTLNGKKLWAGGARPEDQVDAYDPRGNPPKELKPKIADIQKCVTDAAAAKPNAKGKPKATESRAEEAGTADPEWEDAIEDPEEELAENEDEEPQGDGSSETESLYSE